MQKIIITSNQAGQRLDKFLVKYMNKAPKSFFYKMLRKKNITLNGKKAEGSKLLVIGDEVKLFLSEETIEGFQREVEAQAVDHISPPLPIIYEDDHVLIFNKPVGMLSQRAEKSDVSLVEHMINYLLISGALKEEALRTFRPALCNRLDRNTSGIVVAGKSLKGLQVMAELFRKREIGKYYICLVRGVMTENKHITGYFVKDREKNRVTITKEKPAGDFTPDLLPALVETEYRILAGNHGYTLLEINLITGKSHQIRAHLASIGHPVLGDFKYGDGSLNRRLKKEYGLESQLLHAWRIEFPSIPEVCTKLSNKKLVACLPTEFERIIYAIMEFEGTAWLHAGGAVESDK